MEETMPEYPVHPLQAMMDGWSAAWQRERAESQLTLEGARDEKEG